MKSFRFRFGVASLVALAITAGHLIVPDPADAAGGAMFRMHRMWIGDIDTDVHGERYSNPWVSSYVEPHPGYTTGGFVTGQYYPPATAVFSPNGGFTIPRHVVHWGTAPYDKYTFSCDPATCADGYPVSIYYYSYYNYKGVFYPDHQNAPPGTGPTTIDKSVSGFTTEQFDNNYAFGRDGIIKVTPGPNKFGGTMRLFFGPEARWYMFITNGYPCCEKLYGWAWRSGMTEYGAPSGMLDWTEYSPQEIGGTNVSFAGTRVHTYLTTGAGSPNSPGAYIERYEIYFQTKAPWSTGVASVFLSGGAYITSVAVTGYDNRTENRELGVMSLVSPFITHEYVTSFNPSDPVEATTGWGRVYTMQVQFLPEPMGILMLGVGILGLAGMYHLRRR